MSQRWDAFKCPGCPQNEPKLWDLELLKQHYAKKHMDNFHLYKCPKCKKTFASLLSANHHFLNVCHIPEDTDASLYTCNILTLKKNDILQLNSAMQAALKDYVQKAVPTPPLSVDFGVQVSTNEEKMMLNTYTQTDETASFHNVLDNMKMDDLDSSSSVGSMNFEHTKTTPLLTPALTPAAAFMSNWDAMTRTSGSSLSSRLSSLEEKPVENMEEKPEEKMEEKPMSHFEQKPVSNRDPRLRKRSLDTSSTCNSPRDFPAASRISTEFSEPIGNIEEPNKNASDDKYSNFKESIQSEEPKMIRPAMAAHSFDGTGSKEIEARRQSVGGEDHDAASTSTSNSPMMNRRTSNDSSSAWKKELPCANGRVRMDSFVPFRMIPLQRSGITSFRDIIERKTRERDEMNEAPAMKKKRCEYSEERQKTVTKRPSDMQIKHSNGIVPHRSEKLPPVSPVGMAPNFNDNTPKTPESPLPPSSISHPVETYRSLHHQHIAHPSSHPSAFPSDSDTLRVSPPIPPEERNMFPAPVPPPPGFGRQNLSDPSCLPKPPSPPVTKNFFVPPPLKPKFIEKMSPAEEDIRTQFLIETDEKDACVQFMSKNKKIKKMYFKSQFLSSVSSVFERQLREYPRDVQMVVNVAHGSHSFTDAMVMLMNPDCMFPLGCVPDIGGISNGVRLLRMLTSVEHFGLTDVKSVVQKRLFADMCMSIHGSDCVHCIDRVAIAKRYELHIPENVKFTDNATDRWSIKANSEGSMAKQLQVIDKVFRFLKPMF